MAGCSVNGTIWVIRVQNLVVLSEYLEIHPLPILENPWFTNQLISSQGLGEILKWVLASVLVI